MNYPKIINYLNNCNENNALSHAYIFYGPDEISKTEIAFWFARKIIGLENQRAWHPDLFLIKSEKDEIITINLIRELKKILALTPYSASHKIIIIQEAERLSSYSQNAMLKILEEAPNRAVIVLCAKTLDSLLPTIVSRAVKLPFWKFKNKYPEVEEKNTEVFDKLLSADFLDKYSCIDKLGECKPADFFSSWLDFLRMKLLKNPTKKSANLTAISQNIYFKLMETNINPKFAYDELILNL